MVTNKKEPRKVALGFHKAIPSASKEDEVKEKQPKPMFAPQPKQVTTPSPTGGISLASAELETEPFKKRLIKNGYSIVSEDEYGVIARMPKGKPLFMARTKNGYCKPDKRGVAIIPIEIDTAIKVRSSALRLSVSDYLSRLIIDDLKKNNVDF